MELTPQRLREVEFKERWRGYDPEEVDDLLERVAAGIEEIETRVRQATERAVRAEQSAGEGGGGEAEETLRRTLVLAQKTADAAVADAKERAATMVSEAQQRAEGIVAEAEAEARRITEENETRLRENVSTLETARSQLQDDVDGLGRYLEDERDRLRSSLQALISRIESDLQRGAAPTISEVDVPDAPPEAEADEHGRDQASASEIGEASRAEVVEEQVEEQQEDDLGEPTQAHDTLAADEDEPELVLSGPGREIDTDDDAFFAELRGALEDDAPLGPRDEDAVSNRVGGQGPALFDQEVPDEGRLGPFLRRKRREA
jgi:cell division initiation protein